jgi:hypothetical protein
MIDTIAALLITLFAVMPGILGNGIYELIVGSKRNEELWDRIFRIVSFSFLGLALYVLVFVPLFHLPVPLYLFPQTFSSPSIDQTQVVQTVLVLLMMILLSTLSAFFIAFAVKTYNKFSPVTTTHTYDEFIRGYIHGHWVIVNLKSGESYAGILERGDINVKIEERDVILREPALYDKVKKNYFTSTNQYLYFPGDSIRSISVIYDSSIDPDRIVPVNRQLFPNAEQSSEEK